MKFFHRKKSGGPRSSGPVAKPGSGFYPEHSGSDPLTDYPNGTGRRKTHRTSRHNLGRRREVSNRVSNRELLFLVLLVVLLAGGFIGLKIVLSRLAEPTEQEKLSWEANELRMGVAVTGDVPVFALQAGMPYEPYADSAVIGRRLDKWDLTERLVRSSETFLQRNIYDESASRLRQALAATPQNIEARKQLLMIAMQTGSFSEAIPLCIQLLDQNSRQKDVQMMLLQALKAENMHDATVLLADWILRSYPDNLEVMKAAAEARLAMGDTDEALDFFARMLERDRANKSALEGAGKIHFSQGAFKSAIPYFMELVRNSPQIDYYRALALSYAEQNEAGKAIIIIGQAASLYGESEIQAWLLEPAMDRIRDTAEFRSFADRVVGIETRKAIEKIRERETGRQAPALPAGVMEPDVPRPELQQLKPTR